MMNFVKSCKISLAVFFLLTVPYAGKAETVLSHGTAISSTNEMMIEQAERKKSSHKKSGKNFKLSDFSGKWVVNIASIGGESGAATIGTSFISVGQVEIKSDGTGEFNVISGSTYNGVPGQFDNFSYGQGVVTFNLAIIDSKNGAGSFTVVGGGVDDVVNFIATRSKKTGKVARLEGFRFFSAMPVSNLVSYVLTRQNEE